MSNYTKTTDFEAKDSLPSGDSGKIIRGSEFETEFDNIATAIASKSDANNPTFTGTVTIDGLTVNGNTVLGNAATDTVTVTADIASNLLPSADDTYNLGAVGAEWNDLFIDGVANIDSLVADTADINGGTVDGVTIGGSSAGAITGTTITGTSFVTSGDMTFGDNDKAIFGVGSDLQIYHDGSDSYIRDSGQGDLRLRGTQLKLEAASGERFLEGVENGLVRIYYDNAEKLATTSTGIDVTGTVVADSFQTDTANTTTNLLARNSSNAAVYLQNGGTGDVLHVRSGNMAAGQGDLHLKVANNGDISFYEDSGTTAKLFWDASAESLDLTGAGGLDVNTATGSVNIQTGIASADIALGIGSPSTANKVVVTAGGNVGIGTISPNYLLDVEGTGSTLARLNSTSGAATFQISVPNTTDLCDINFGDSALDGAGRIRYRHNGDSMAFNTNNAEAMRIDSSGNLLVGTTSSNLYNDTSGSGIALHANGRLDVLRTNAATAIFNRTGTDGEVVLFHKDGVSVGSVGTTSGGWLYTGAVDTALVYDYGANSIQPYQPNTSSLRDNAVDLGSLNARFRDLYLSGGAYLGGTAAANKLDDYEQGTFTATLTPETSGTITMNSSFDKLAYTKIGRVVTITGRIKVSAVSSPVGQFVRLSLPFAIGNDDEESERPTGTVTLQNAAQDIDKYCIHPTSGTISYIQIGRTNNFASNAAPDFSGNELLSIALTYIT